MIERQTATATKAPPKKAAKKKFQPTLVHLLTITKKEAEQLDEIQEKIDAVDAFGRERERHEKKFRDDLAKKAETCPKAASELLRLERPEKVDREARKKSAAKKAAIASEAVPILVEIAKRSLVALKEVRPDVVADLNKIREKHGLPLQPAMPLIDVQERERLRRENMQAFIRMRRAPGRIRGYCETALGARWPE